MAKKREVPEEYLEWIQDLPDDVRTAVLEKFQGSAAADKIANLHAGMTTAQQRAAELERLEPDAEYGRQMRDWSNQHKDIFNILPEYAPLMRRYKPAEVEAAMRALQQNQQQANQQQDIVDALETGEITWEEAQPLLRQLRKQSQSTAQQLSDWQKFHSEEWPTAYQGVQEILQQSERRQAEMLPVILNTVAEMLDENNRKQREFGPVVKAILERKANSLHDAIAHVYGEEDREAEIEAARLEAAEKARAETEEATRKQYDQRVAAEGAVTGNIDSPVFQRDKTRRRHEQNQFSKDEAAVQARVMNILRNGVAE